MYFFIDCYISKFGLQSFNAVDFGNKYYLIIILIPLEVIKPRQFWFRRITALQKKIGKDIIMSVMLVLIIFEKLSFGTSLHYWSTQKYHVRPCITMSVDSKNT